jgi:hypothetical protein
VFVPRPDARAISERLRASSSSRYEVFWLASSTTIADPARHHVEDFIALAQRRAHGLAYRSLTDEPDVAALAARLG